MITYQSISLALTRLRGIYSNIIFHRRIDHPGIIDHKTKISIFDMEILQEAGRDCISQPDLSQLNIGSIQGLEPGVIYFIIKISVSGNIHGGILAIPNAIQPDSAAIRREFTDIHALVVDAGSALGLPVSIKLCLGL